MADQEDGGARSQRKSATTIIAMFGGIRPMAAKVGVAVTTVQGWKERGVIPAARHEEILAAATRHGIALTRADMGGQGATPVPDDVPAPEAATSTGAAGEKEPPDATAPWSKQASSKPAPESAAESFAKSSPAPPPAQAKGRAGRWMRAAVVGLLLGVIGVGAGGYAWWQWWADPGVRPWVRVAPGPGAAELAALEGRTKALVAELTAAQKRLAALESIDRGAVPENVERRIAVLEAADRDVVPDDVEKRLAILEKGSDATGATEAIDKRIAALESAAQSGVPESIDQRITALETADKSGVPDSVEKRLAAVEQARSEGVSESMEKRIAALEEKSGAPVLPEKLEKRLAALEQNTDKPMWESVGARGAALLLAVGQLRTALAGASPFATELRSVRALAGEEARIVGALDGIAGRAEKGIATRTMLRENFAGVAVAVVRAARLPEEPKWYDKALHQITSLATVRRTDRTDGATPAALVARAEGRLAANDLAGAIAALDILEGQAGAAARTWLAEARARHAAEQALRLLQSLAIAGVGATGDGAAEEDAAKKDAGD